MNVVAIKNIKGHYANGEIHFSWRLPDDAPEVIHIYRVHVKGQNRYVKKEDKYHRALRNSPFSEQMACEQNENTLAVYTYLFFLAKRDEELDESELVTLLFDPTYTKTVVVGNAEVYFQVKSRALNGLKHNVFEHKIILKSQVTIPEGLLVYSFNSEKQRFSVPFPSEIEDAKITYEPFYTFHHGDEESNIIIEPAEHAKFCISLTEKRLSWF